MKRFLFLFTLCVAGVGGFGQEAWDVQDCIGYALEQ